ALGGETPPATVPTPDYGRFAERGARAVLEVGIARLALDGKGGRNPRLVLVIDARARLIRLPDNYVLWSAEHLTFESPRAKLLEWTADDSRLLRSELDHGLDFLAARIAAGVFPVTRVALVAPRSGAPGPGAGRTAMTVLDAPERSHVEQHLEAAVDQPLAVERHRVGAGTQAWVGHRLLHALVTHLA